MKTTLKIGTRGSELALKQTELTIAAIKAHNPGIETEVVIIRTDGDERTDIPLCKVNKATQTQEKGVFIAALEEALACRSGIAAISPVAGEIAGRHSGQELIRAIESLQKAIEYAQGNVSVAAICGWLQWTLR